MRVLQFHRAEVASALLTLIAVGVGIATVRTFAHDVTVGKELTGFLVVILFALLFDELAVIVELAEEVGSELVVGGTCRAAVHVERDAELLERILDQLMIAVAHVLRRDAFLLGTDRDRHTVLVAAADEDDLPLLQPEVTYIDVCRDIHAGKMSYMYTAVGVRQSRRHCGALEFLFFHKMSACCFFAAKLL